MYLTEISCRTCPMVTTKKMPGLEAKREYYCCTHSDAEAAYELFPRCKDKPDTPGRIECIRKGNPEMRIKGSPKWCPRKIVNTPQEVDKHGAYYIINRRLPHGVFYCKEANGTYVGIDNRTGDAWVEEFDFLEPCLRWLVSSGERDPYESETG